ncbi:protein of unknown function [Methylorubrum extorquens DM4]|uniref:Uncharacterized protein n=1 Tax=Methylorubrum extorquens (strain DSM 6343 / CIP 106787 / DM4) TaxID=661410 RepID=C7CCL3_METED|nr:protein of unknown function [Methylorubrum extorquens DM4]
MRAPLKSAARAEICAWRGSLPGCLLGERVIALLVLTAILHTLGENAAQPCRLVPSTCALDVVPAASGSRESEQGNGEWRRPKGRHSEPEGR